MNISAIGSIGGGGLASIGGYASLAGLGGTSRIAGAPSSDIAGSLGSTAVLSQLIEQMNSARLSPSTKVAISDAAKNILGGESGSTGANMGELSQALIVALLMQLLEV